VIGQNIAKKLPLRRKWRKLSIFLGHQIERRSYVSNFFCRRICLTHWRWRWHVTI